MAVKRPLVLQDGIVQEIPSGDTLPTSVLPGVATFGTAVLDFGATPAEDATVLVTGLSGLSIATHKKAFVQADDSTATNTANAHRLLAYWGQFSCEYVSATSMNIHCNLLVGLATGTFTVHYVIA